MLFAITWSLGGSCDKAGRAVFDAFLREKVASLAAAAAGTAADGAAAALQLPENALMPASATVYEWCYDRQVSWLVKQTARCVDCRTDANVLGWHVDPPTVSANHRSAYHTWAYHFSSTPPTVLMFGGD
jgi:hypothetical protein